MRLVLPRLYVILDATLLNNSPHDCARELAAAGVRLLQYRDKMASARDLLATSRELVSSLNTYGTSLVVNDRPDVAVLAGAAGVHVGQEDLDPEQARAVVGEEMWIGTSTHNLEQFRRAAATSVDYIAVGPIFATTSKANPDPVVGLELIRQVRHLTEKSIVAIGGITLERAASVIEAGADSVAVIRDVVCAEEPGERARRFLDMLDAANHAAAV
ncbi:MAG: thiamine-phosphate diphosphorylase [Candidatus Acidoferrum typicum]|nr:thiamine-phosphate diphosphorylase [Candidatus Acidoferrum typicum]